MKKSFIIIFLVLIMSILMGTCVIATETTINLEGSTTVPPGGTSTLNLKISSEETIGVISGKIEYDSNIDNIILSAKNNWTVTYNSETGVFNAYKAEGAKIEEIMEIKYTVSDTVSLGTIKVDDIKMVNINYELKSVESITKEINIQKVIEKIQITNQPIKMQYIEGQNFDTTGMKVTATYNDGTTKEITEYTITNGESLSVGQTSVTISYKENGVTKTTTQAITVEEKLKANLKNYGATEENGVKYIENIRPNTKIQGLIENIETNGTIKFYKGDAEITNINSKMQTGMTIKIILGNQETSCTLVVKGDLNGDGEMGDIDLLRLVRYQAGLDTNLNGAYLKAADIYKDGTCADNKDLLKIARVLAGLEVL